MATRWTAAFTGAWAVVWLLPLEAWLEHHKTSSNLVNSLSWFAALVLLFFLPAYFFVLGKDTEAFSRNWYLDPEERARYGVVIVRMLVCFASAAVVGIICSALFSLVPKEFQP